MKLPPDQFASRQRALEEAFFQNVNAKLLANFKDELAQLEEANKLAHVAEIMDQRVLRELVNVGVKAESLLAMRFVPMIRVAWADRTMSRQEKEAILKAVESENENLKPGTPTYNLLSEWLEKPPDSAVFNAWKAYIHALAQNMPPGSLTGLRDRTSDLCYRAARAAGGV